MKARSAAIQGETSAETSGKGKDKYRKFMMKPLIIAMLMLMTGCQATGVAYFGVAHNNLSNSYVYPYRIAINGRFVIPAGGLKGC